jgi:uncharacterized protein YlaI
MVIKCDVCGRFVSIDDLEKGLATRRLVTPDSHFTCEEYETRSRSGQANKNTGNRPRDTPARRVLEDGVETATRGADIEVMQQNVGYLALFGRNMELACLVLFLAF